MDGVTIRVLTLLRDPITGHITDDSQTVKILKIPRLQKRAGSSPAPGTRLRPKKDYAGASIKYSGAVLLVKGVYPDSNVYWEPRVLS